MQTKTFILNVIVKTGQRRVDPSAVIFIRQRQNQTGNGQQAITGISEAEQRRKQYQAGVEVTSTGSEFQAAAISLRLQGKLSFPYNCQKMNGQIYVLLC